MKINNFIKEQRKKLRLSEGEFAKKLEIRRNFLINIEKGYSECPLIVFLKILELSGLGIVEKSVVSDYEKKAKKPIVFKEKQKLHVTAKRSRKLKGLTQLQLSEQLSISSSTITKFENEGDIQGDILLKIMKKLDLRIIDEKNIIDQINDKQKQLGNINFIDIE